jgi:hypothetical protein
VLTSITAFCIGRPVPELPKVKVDGPFFKIDFPDKRLRLCLPNNTDVSSTKTPLKIHPSILLTKEITFLNAETKHHSTTTSYKLMDTIWETRPRSRIHHTLYESSQHSTFYHPKSTRHFLFAVSTTQIDKEPVGGTTLASYCITNI